MSSFKEIWDKLNVAYVAPIVNDKSTDESFSCFEDFLLQSSSASSSSDREKTAKSSSCDRDNPVQEKETTNEMNALFCQISPIESSSESSSSDLLQLSIIQIQI